MKNSAIFAPSAIGVLPDDQEHYVVFEGGSTYGYRCSAEPKAVKRVRLATVLEVLRARNSELGREGLWLLTSKMLQVIRQRAAAAGLPLAVSSDAEAIAEQRSPLESAGYLARTYFSSELIIVE